MAMTQEDRDAWLERWMSALLERDDDYGKHERAWRCELCPPHDHEPAQTVLADQPDVDERGQLRIEISLPYCARCGFRASEVRVRRQVARQAVEISGEASVLSLGTARAEGLYGEMREALETEDDWRVRVELRCVHGHCWSADAVGSILSERMPTDSVQSLLGLVTETPPDKEAIDAWTDEQRNEVVRWATACHLQASDNDVDVPPLPDVLRVV